jgi:short-subunit dehydrogenase
MLNLNFNQMLAKTKKIILLTGASSDRGLACANKLQACDFTVYGSTRNLNRIKSVSFKPIELDVTHEDSVDRAYAKIIQAEGKLDVLINNASYGTKNHTYTIPAEITKQQIEVNFYGLVRMSSKVLPAMIAQNNGLIININPLAGLVSLLYQSMYSASKFAVEGYLQALQIELRNTDVKVVSINPADYKSHLSENRKKLPFPVDVLKIQAKYRTAKKCVKNDEYLAQDTELLAKHLCIIVAGHKPS